MRSVVITGSSKGIGLEIAKLFSKNNYYVVLNGRSENFSINLEKECDYISGDVSDYLTHEKLINSAIKKCGKLDVYINCAGISQWKPIEKVSDEFWNLIIDSNLKGTFYGCKAASKFFADKGVIINISSLAGKRGSANNSVYCASKFGVNGLTQALAKELGQRNIRVNALCPVYVKTDTLLRSLEDNDSPANGENVESYLETFTRQQSSLKRLPTGSEVASFCLFLASEGAEAITGQCINVDCGVLPQ